MVTRFIDLMHDLITNLSIEEGRFAIRDSRLGAITVAVYLSHCVPVRLFVSFVFVSFWTPPPRFLPAMPISRDMQITWDRRYSSTESRIPISYLSKNTFLRKIIPSLKKLKSHKFAWNTGFHSYSIKKKKERKNIERLNPQRRTANYDEEFSQMIRGTRTRYLDKLDETSYFGRVHRFRNISFETRIRILSTNLVFVVVDHQDQREGGA